MHGMFGGDDYYERPTKKIMKTLPEIFKDMHDDDVGLAHLFLAYIVAKYGKDSPEFKQFKQLHDQEKH